MLEGSILCLKPVFRLEWRGQNGQDEAEQCEHDLQKLGDSFPESMRIRFSVHTTAENHLKAPTSTGMMAGSTVPKNELTYGATPALRGYVSSIRRLLTKNIFWPPSTARNQAPIRCLIFFRIPAKSLNYMVADAVAVKPVSTAEFPANREKSREFHRTRPLCEILNPNSQIISMASSPFPYSTKQGIIFTEQGIRKREQRIFTQTTRINFGLNFRYHQLFSKPFSHNAWFKKAVG